MTSLNKGFKKSCKVDSYLKMVNDQKFGSKRNKADMIYDRIDEPGREQSDRLLRKMSPLDHILVYQITISTEYANKAHL